MSNGIIARLIPLAPAGYTGTAGINGINPNFPAANLGDPQPKTVIQSNTGAVSIGMVVDIDYGANVDMDGLAVLFANVSASATLDAFATPDGTPMPAFGAETPHRLPFAGLGGAFGVAATTRNRVRHAVAFGAVVARRYVRIYVVDLTANNPDGVVRIGIMSALKTVQLSADDNFELGSGRKIEDQSIIRTLPGGETAIERGGRTPVWRGTWSNLTEAQMRSLWALLSEIGTGAPMLFVENPDAVVGQNEGIHYGLWRSPDFHERVQLDKQRIDMTIGEMT